jgi:hypothetical protein
MDWTGGTRRPFTAVKNNNTALQRQKAHSARARAAVQHEPFTSHQKASVGAHNDDTRVSSCKGTITCLLPPSISLTWPGSSAYPLVLNNHDISRNPRQAGSRRSSVNLSVQEDDEVLLIARRRKLLARNDWLALNPTRPLRLGFPPTGDKDEVWRRKKIKRSGAAYPKTTQRRLLTPLFEERLDPPAHLMSGALPPAQDDPIQVKVGTSAFDHRSQPSRRSHAPGNLSAGPQPTILSHLSEGPMLLGEDGDNFDADQVEVPTFVQNGPEICEGTIRPSSSVSEDQYYEQSAHHKRTRESSLASTNDSELQQHRAWTDGAGVCSTADLKSRPGQNTNYSLISRNAVPGLQIDDTGDEQAVFDFEDLDRDIPADPAMNATQEARNVSSDDAEKAWKQLMGIVTQSASFTSNKALDSSSEHLTTSEATQRVFLELIQYDDDTFASTPEAAQSYLNHIDLEQREITLDQTHLTEDYVLLAEDAQPPAHSLKVAEDQSDNEALWREFIIGSQDSESGDELHSAWQRSRGKTRQSLEHPQSLEICGPGTPDRTTKGEAITVRPTLFAVTDASFEDQLDHREDSIEDGNEDDSPSLAPESTCAGNIHVMQTKKLDPRRFKRSGERNAYATRKENRTFSLRHITRRGTEDH